MTQKDKGKDQEQRNQDTLGRDGQESQPLQGGQEGAGSRQSGAGGNQGGNDQGGGAGDSRNAGQNTGQFGSGSDSYDQADLATRANSANRQAADNQAGNRAGTQEADPASTTRQNLTHGGAQQLGDRDLGKMGNAGGKAPGVDIGQAGGRTQEE